MSQSTVPYWQVDAFTACAFGGNPAGVMVLDAWLTDDRMLQIAAETGLPATAFAVRDQSGAADWELCWFTPSREIALCGHATLATGHVMLCRDSGDRVTFRTRNAGVVEVLRMGEGYELALPAIPTEAGEHPEAAALLGKQPMEVRRSPKGYNLFVYEDAASIRALAPDMAGLAKLGTDQFIATAPGDEVDVISRVFVSGGGVDKGADEDAVTGSAHCALAPYWTSRLGKRSLTAHQASGRGGYLTMRLEGERVWLGGQCVTILEGSFAV